MGKLPEEDKRKIQEVWDLIEMEGKREGISISDIIGWGSMYALCEDILKLLKE